MAKTEAYLDINKVRTKVTTWGRWVEDSKPSNEEIIVIIPGNPGVTGFYDLFAKTLHKKLNLPVWCVGHAGHNIPENSVTPLPGLKENADLYGLRGQIDHKIDFFEKYVPDTAKVHLIGHSIGSYVILEMLEHPAVKNKVVDVQLLFPTIEHMVGTSNGKFLTGFVSYVWVLLCYFSWVFTALPGFIQTSLLFIYMTIAGIPLELHYNNIIELIKPKILRRVFFLAYEEMDKVNERNDAVIKRNLDKIKLLYGVTDGWAPASFCDRIKIDIPNVDANLTNFDHTFVFTSSLEIADIVCTNIKSIQ